MGARGVVVSSAHRSSSTSHPFETANIGFSTMPLDVNYDEICSKFDRLISEGIIKFKPSHPVLITDNGMTVCAHHYLRPVFAVLIPGFSFVSMLSNHSMTNHRLAIPSKVPKRRQRVKPIFNFKPSVPAVTWLSTIQTYVLPRSMIPTF